MSDESVAAIAAVNATLIGMDKRLDRVVILLQGNGKPGLVTTVAKLDTKVRACEKELDDRKQTGLTKSLAKLAGWVSIAAVILGSALAFLLHQLTH